MGILKDRIRFADENKVLYENSKGIKCINKQQLSPLNEQLKNMDYPNIKKHSHRSACV